MVCQGRHVCAPSPYRVASVRVGRGLWWWGLLWLGVVDVRDMVVEDVVVGVVVVRVSGFH